MNWIKFLFLVALALLLPSSASAAKSSGIPSRLAPLSLVSKGVGGNAGWFNFAPPLDGTLGQFRGLNVLKPTIPGTGGWLGGPAGAFNYLYQDGVDLFGMHMQILG